MKVAGSVGATSYKSVASTRVRPIAPIVNPGPIPQQGAEEQSMLAEATRMTSADVSSLSAGDVETLENMIIKSELDLD